MAEKKRVPPDREIVERFVEHLRHDGYPDLKVDSWPEDDHPGQSVVEAIAGISRSNTRAWTPFQTSGGFSLVRTL